MCNEKLRTRAILETDRNGGVRHAARAWGVTHGMISRALRGGDSPTLRRLWGIRKSNRTRLNIDCPPELKSRFDSARGTMSRSDYLQHLLDLADGVGGLDY